MSATHNRLSRRSRRGFSLIELLVVIGILLVILGIALPAYNVISRRGNATRTAADLQTIAVALEAYRSDFGDYPRPNGPYSGAQVLCKALVGPGPATGAANTNFDGNDGPGFRVRAGVGGRAYGPYIQPDKFPVSQPIDDQSVLLDREEMPILYFPAFFKNANVGQLNQFVADNNYGTDMTDIAKKPLYNSADVLLMPPYPSTTRYLLPEQMRVMLGDTDNNGMVGGSETNTTSKSFLLWTPGQDKLYGPATLDIAGVKACDDVIVHGP